MCGWMFVCVFEGGVCVRKRKSIMCLGAGVTVGVKERDVCVQEDE